MPSCQFSEDEYEDHLLHELRYLYGGGELHYKPTRPQEKNLGYDFAVSTNHPLFNGQGILVAASLLTSNISQPIHWTMPVRMANAFIQCKVPYYVTRQRPENTHMWNRWLSNFYRIKIDSPQRETLAKVADAVGRLALVCYAAPCFYTHSETDAYVNRGEVVKNTKFQEVYLLNQHKHEFYTYKTAAGDGLGFSEPEEISLFSFFEEINRILKDSPVVSVFKHIQKLWYLLSTIDDFSLYLDITRHDVDMARHVIGDFADAEVEPDIQDSDTFAEIVAKELRIRRCLKEKLGVSWIIFAMQ